VQPEKVSELQTVLMPLAATVTAPPHSTRLSQGTPTTSKPAPGELLDQPDADAAGGEFDRYRGAPREGPSGRARGLPLDRIAGWIPWVSRRSMYIAVFAAANDDMIRVDG
jgi:hypothetical protein